MCNPDAELSVHEISYKLWKQHNPRNPNHSAHDCNASPVLLLIELSVYEEPENQLQAMEAPSPKTLIKAHTLATPLPSADRCATLA